MLFSMMLVEVHVLYFTEFVTTSCNIFLADTSNCGTRQCGKHGIRNVHMAESVALSMLLTRRITRVWYHLNIIDSISALSIPCSIQKW